MADYVYNVTISGGGASLANTGNPPMEWDQGALSWVLQYNEANLKVTGPSDYANVVLSGTKRLSITGLSGLVGEMNVDSIFVYRLNDVGAIVEFWYQDELQGAMTLVSGTGTEYINAAKMIVTCELTWSEP